NFYMDFKLIPNKLSFKTTYNYSFGSLNERRVAIEYNNGVTDVASSRRKSPVTSYNQIWDNVLTFNEAFGKHYLAVMAGYSFRSETNDGFFATGTELTPAPSWDHEEYWWLYNAAIKDADNVNDFDPNDRYKYARGEFGSSYFGRIAYNYDDRYLLYATLRRDGSNKFQQKWGNFPTFGAGWVISEESFFNVPVVNFLKLRGSWGRLGNDAVPSAIGAATLEPIFTAINDQLVPGITVQNFFDYLDRWETKEETNVGITSALFGS